MANLTKLETYLNIYGIESTILISQNPSSPCFYFRNCFMKRLCCMDYLEQLIEQDIRNDSLNKLNPECMTYLASQNFAGAYKYGRMIVWSGCTNPQKDITYRDTSIVFDETRMIFYKSMDEALCYNGNSEGLIPIPNNRICTPSVTDILRQTSNTEESLKIFNTNCSLLSIQFMPSISETLQNSLMLNVINCFENDIYNDNVLKNQTDLLNVPPNILCNIAQNIIVTFNSETYWNVFCAIASKDFVIGLSNIFIGFTPTDGNVPSFSFMFNPLIQQVNGKFYTAAEISRLNMCTTLREVYSNVEMCEIENCLSQSDFIFPLGGNQCSVVNSFEKLNVITLNGISSKNNLTVLLVKYFNLTQKYMYSYSDYLYMDNESNAYELSFNSDSNGGLFLTNSTSRIKEFINVGNMLNQSATITDSIIYSNFLLDSNCPPPTFLSALNKTSLLKLIILGEIPSCPNVTQITPMKICEIIPYLIITEGTFLTDFIKDSTMNSVQEFIFYNNTFALRRLCGNESRVYKVQEQQGSFTEADFLITVILLPSSIIGLLVTIVTYCIHPQLRTLPGLMVMAMSTYLLITYCGFLGVALISGENKFCFLFVIGTHFALLSTLTWMAFISVDSAMTFASVSLKIRRENNIYKRFIILNIIACSIVVPFWLPGVVNYACGGLCLRWIPVTYSHVPNCRLSGSFSMTYGITGPGMAGSGVSMTSLILAIIGFFRVSFNSTKLKVSKDRNKTTKLVLLFSIKLGLLTGFSLGMMQISILLGWNVGTLIFSAINSSLGIFIAIFFTGNSRVCRLYTKKIGKENSTTKRVDLTLS